MHTHPEAARRRLKQSDENWTAYIKQVYGHDRNLASHYDMVLDTGRLGYASGQAAPPVVLYTYRLQGTITDAAGRPVAGATVVTRTQDRDFWTFSQPSDAGGHYVSFFTASDETGADPVPLTVQVASGAVSYASPAGKTVSFSALRSATMDIRLPASPAAPLALPTATSYPGAVYEGTLVGVSGPGGVVRPVSATWPDASGAPAVKQPFRSCSTDATHQSVDWQVAICERARSWPLIDRYASAWSLNSTGRTNYRRVFDTVIY